MRKYIPKPKSFRQRVKGKLCFANYATKEDLKISTGFDTSKFATKLFQLLKSDVDKLDIDKFKNTPTKLNNLKSKVDKLNVDKLTPVLNTSSDVVKNDKKLLKNMYIMLRQKALKIKYLILLTQLLILLLMLKQMRLKSKYSVLLAQLVLLLLMRK